MAVILVVEDDVLICQNAAWMIGDMGHDTMVAGDIPSALLHLFAANHIDALFVDIRLAALAFGGYSVANQAVDLRPDLKVLYTSGSALTNAMTDMFVGGGQFLQKPYSPLQLEASIDGLLQ